MPRTTINVIFNGRDNGLLNLFNQINTAVRRLDSNMNRLEQSISRVDNRLRSLRSSSGFLSSLGNGFNIRGGGGAQAVGLRTFQQGISSGASLITSILGRTASFTTSIFRGVTSTITNAVSSAYKNVSNMIAFVDKAIMTFGNSIRQIAQGVQSFGIAFSIFVSAPLAKILQGVVTESVNFDDALVLVRKTTGATTQDIDKLGESLTQLSLGLPTSREDLAKIAEDWGAIGIAISDEKGVDTMTELVRLTSMFVSSVRGVTAEDAVEKLGRFAAIYYPDVQSFVKEAEKLMSVLSALEDVTPLDAGEIMAAAQRLAPVTKSLEIAPERALALAAAVASVNVSAERAGTQTSTALIDMVTNVDKVAELFGTTEQKIQSLMSENPDEFFYTLAASIGAVEDPLRRVQIVEEVFGKVGGKSIGSLVNSIPNLSAILAVANDEFARGTYLQWQFNASLDSTKSQLQILRNNLTYAGAAIGDALLPYITKFVTIAVPAIQMLTEWFKGLNDQVKLQVVGWMAFLAIAGPLVVFFSSLLFMVGLTISGLSSLFGVIGMIGSGIIGFLGAVIGFLSPINLLVAALAGMAIYAVYLAKDLSTAGTLVQGYVGKFFTWGYNLISSFADGIASAASVAYNAVVGVINAFIGLIQSFSPPKKGPLKDIGTWGKNLMMAYADGIMKAGPALVNAVSYVNEGMRQILEGFSPETVSMFSNVFNSIKSVINAVGAHIGLESDDINRRIESAAGSVATFIANLQSGVPDSLQEISSFLGGLSGDFETLITLQASYAEGEIRLRQIEKALKDINSETDKMIAKVITQEGLTADQQSAMIRRIKLEQAAKEQSLQTEQTALQAQQDAMKADIDKKQEIVDILTSLIFPTGSGADSAADKNKADKPEKPGIEPIDMVPFETAAGVLDKVKERFDATGESAEDFTKKLGAARAMVEGFVAAVRGDDKANYAEMPESFWKGWEAGSQVRQKVLDFLEAIDNLWRGWDNIKSNLDNTYFAYITGFSSGANGGELNWDMIKYLGLFTAAALILGWAVGQAATAVENFITSMFSRGESGDEKSAIEIMMDRVSNAVKAFKTGWDESTKNLDLQGFTQALGNIGIAVAAILTSETLWKAVGAILGDIATQASKVVIGISGIIEIAKIFAGVGNKKSFEDMYVALAKGKKPTEELADEAGKLYDNFVNIKAGVDDAIWNVKRWWAFLTGQGDIGLNPANKTEIDSSGGGGSTIGENASGGGGSRGFGAVGESAGKSFTDGFKKYLELESTAQSTSMDMVRLLDTAQMNATKQTGQTGEFFGGDFLAGVKAWFENIDHFGVVLGTLITVYDAWRTLTGQGEIKAKGEISGKDFLDGVDDKFNTDTSYFTTLITRMGLWITEFASKIIDIGKEIGKSIIDGMVDSIKGGGSAFWGAIEGLINFAWSKMPAWFKKFWEMTHPADGETKSNQDKGNSRSTGEPEVSYVPPDERSTYGINKGYNPKIAPQPTSGYNITINIDPSVATQIDRRSIAQLADEIYARMVRDMKLAGV